MAINNTSIEGLDAFIKDLLKFGDSAMPYMKKASDEAGSIIWSKAVRKVPINLGLLQVSLKRTKSRLKPGKYYVDSKISIDKGAAYGVPVELGHNIVINGRIVGAIQARPFMRPAADESKDEIIRIMTDAMNKALAELGDKK